MERTERERESNGREVRGAGWWRMVLFQAQRERRGDIYGAHAGVQNTPRLKLETKTPVGAKSEIFT